MLDGNRDQYTTATAASKQANVREMMQRLESELAQERAARQKVVRRRMWWSMAATIVATIVAVLAVVMVMGYRVHDVEVQAANQQIKAANETIRQERQRASWLEKELSLARHGER